MENKEVQLDRKDLKIKALLEKINELEEKIADLRVEMTVQYNDFDKALLEASNENDRLNNENADLKEKLDG